MKFSENFKFAIKFAKISTHINSCSKIIIIILKLCAWIVKVFNRYSKIIFLYKSFKVLRICIVLQNIVSLTDEVQNDMRSIQLEQLLELKWYAVITLSCIHASRHGVS